MHAGLRPARSTVVATLRSAQRAVRQRFVGPARCLAVPSARRAGTNAGGEKQQQRPLDMNEFEMFEADAEETLVFGHFTGGFSICGNEVRGSLLLYPRSYFGWSVTDVESLTKESLSLLWLHNPKPDILLLGTGDQVHQLDPDLVSAIRDLGIAVDTMSTVNAAATFNILNTEQRNVAAALIALK